jgi:plastocyanin
MTGAIVVATLFGVSIVLFLVGLALVIWLFVRPRQRGTHAIAILSERFARGEISSDDYHDRLSTLQESSIRPRSAAVVLAVSLVAAGIVGTVGGGVWVSNSSWNWMGDMMNGGMGSMMSMMQSGSTERKGDAADPDATTTTVVSREFSFQPAEVSVRAGETVNIELRNEGHMFHTFTAPELDLDLRAQSGDVVAGAITPREPGAYEFFCSVPQHAEMGMRGTLVVSE